MKNEIKRTQLVSESRKIRKPLMEKKRRARINDSLETLKRILLDSKTTLKEASGKKSGQRTAKLEKADILEMTVTYLQHLHNKLHGNEGNDFCKSKLKEEIRIRPADSSCEVVTLLPTKLDSGEIVFVVPANLTSSTKAKKNDYEEHYTVKARDSVWRPW